ncbi:FAD/NAD(P)-binding domain-containing protein [Nemania serpens]|nr:FAD/NAD(P)-binding domain-containing protein [Nemania serpens]
MIARRYPAIPTRLPSPLSRSEGWCLWFRCADVLLAHEFKVTILEPRDHIGGRVHHGGLNWIYALDSGETHSIGKLALEAGTPVHRWNENREGIPSEESTYDFVRRKAGRVMGAYVREPCCGGEGMYVEPTSSAILNKVAWPAIQQGEIFHNSSARTPERGPPGQKTLSQPKKVFVTFSSAFWITDANKGAFPGYKNSLTPSYAKERNPNSCLRYVENFVHGKSRGKARLSQSLLLDVYLSPAGARRRCSEIRLWFREEHEAPFDERGTVAGAHLSGELAAEEIVVLYGGSVTGND